LSKLKKGKNPFESRKEEIHTHRLFKMALRIVAGHPTSKNSLLDFEQEYWKPFLSRYVAYKDHCRTSNVGVEIYADKDGKLYIQQGNTWLEFPILDRKTRKSVVPSKRQLANRLIIFKGIYDN
jgi:hypothetical protein